MSNFLSNFAAQNCLSMKKLLLLPLLLMAVVVMAEQSPSLVPAMIIYDTNGVKNVVQLDVTNLTDLIILQDSASLAVDIPESSISGVRSITFAMVPIEEIQNGIESAENPIVRSVEKVLRDGQVFIRLLLHDGSTLEYDMRGNKIINL